MYVVPKNSIKSTKSMVEDSDKSKTGSVKVDVQLDLERLLRSSNNHKLNIYDTVISDLPRVFSGGFLCGSYMFIFVSFNLFM